MLTMNSRATTGKDKRKLVFAVTKELPQAVWDTLHPWEESSETLPVFYNSDGELVENGGESEDGKMFEGFEGSGYSVDVDEADRDEDICGPEADPPLDVEARSVEDHSEGTPPPSSDDESTAPPHSKWKITSRSLSPVASRQPRDSVVGDMHNATRNVSEDAELPAPTRRTVSMPAPTLDELRRGGLRQWSMALVLYGLPERGELDQ
ncbi:hypothetical protein FISHEDRAFT_55078 [Fistulina hepatica ATCC 64428]|uniref:Uncharacterized protein n=1 Tax=Fistulina hepatica ATCC 64428 TaxID=1128425 RepID=A0A0D7APA2_9AGAR|nr:hypothetical protein FISHEDRAFT_55078 [Fistulina hepatica ATCC 64428]